MKNCRFCACPSHDSASRCHECGAEFAEGQNDAKPAESGEFVPASLDGEPFGPANRFPAEYWMLVGVGLSACGYAYTVVAVIAFYLIFKYARPRANWELLLLASGFTGVDLIKTFQLLSTHQTPIHFLEPFLVTNAAITLLFTGQRWWARLLLVYSLLGMFIEPTAAFLSDPRNFRVRDNLFTMIFLGLAVWLLARWMARQKQVNDAANATSIFVLRKT